MPAGDILTLDKPIAPRLIRILYAIALVLIALFVVAGVARGIASMVPGRPMMMAPAAPAAPQSNPAASNQAAPATQPARPMMAGRRFGQRMFARRGFGRRGFMMRHRPSMLMGIVRIVITLVIGAILLIGVRILAEIAGAILAMPRRE